MVKDVCEGQRNGSKGWNMQALHWVPQVQFPALPGPLSTTRNDPLALLGMATAPQKEVCMKKHNLKGQSDSTVGRAFALQRAELGSIPGTPNGPLSTTRNNS